LSEVLTLFALSFIHFSCLFFCITFESDEFAHQVLVHIHHCSIVVKITAVVFCGENSYQLFVFAEEAVAVFHYLMTSAYQV
jgi:hypothetical protein